MKFWKAVFWISALVFALQLLQFPSQQSNRFENAVQLLIAGFSLIPLYGFAYQKPIGSKSIATGIFLLNLPACALALAYSLTPEYLSLEKGQLFFTVLGLAVLFVLIYPLYSYAFRSPHLWQPQA